MANNKKLSFIEYVKEYEFLLVGIVVVCFTIFLTVKLMIPNILKGREIYDNKNLLKKKLENLETKNKTITAMDENLLKDNFAKMNYVIPESKDYALLFTTLDSLQEKLGVAITRTDFELGSVSTKSATLAKNKKDDQFTIPVTLEVMGTFDQLQSFLNELTSLSGRLITCDQIKIQVLNPELVKATLSGKTYFNPLPKSIGAVDAPVPNFNENYKKIFDKIIENPNPAVNTDEDNQEVPLGRKNLFF